MKRGRASGMDGIPIECVLGHRGSSDRPTHLVSPVDDILRNLLNAVLTSGIFPNVWRRAAFSPLLKGGGEVQLVRETQIIIV